MSPEATAIIQAVASVGLVIFVIALCIAVAFMRRDDGSDGK
jgi:hypothetical protein